MNNQAAPALPTPKSAKKIQPTQANTTASESNCKPTINIRTSAQGRKRVSQSSSANEESKGNFSC
jgi:hypothetical protein